MKKVWIGHLTAADDTTTWSATRSTQDTLLRELREAVDAETQRQIPGIGYWTVAEATFDGTRSTRTVIQMGVFLYGQQPEVKKTLQ